MTPDNPNAKNRLDALLIGGNRAAALPRNFLFIHAER